jgi:U4/U6.U5 tri-snRNP-associated protein 3
MLSELTEEEQMARLMGISGFGTTKGKAVDDNAMGAARGAVSMAKKMKYRQYMNRKGGFNRSLNHVAGSRK